VTDVKFGDLLVRNQVVGVADVVDIQLLDEVSWDGIAGLAYPSPVLTGSSSTPIFDTAIAQGVLHKQGLANQFAYYIDDDKGSLSFGGPDCSVLSHPQAPDCGGAFGWSPVVDKTYWTIGLNDVKFSFPDQPDSSKSLCKDGCHAIIDSGTYLIYGPNAQVYKMLEHVGSCNDLKKLPTIVFELRGEGGSDGHTLTLAPKDYILEFDVEGRRDCVLGISPDSDIVWTLGQVFLRSFYAVFDRDRDRVGFARLPERLGSQA